MSTTSTIPGHPNASNHALYILVIDSPEGRYVFCTTHDQEWDGVLRGASGLMMGTSPISTTFEERADACLVRAIRVETPESVALYARAMTARQGLFSPAFEASEATVQKIEALLEREGIEIGKDCLASAFLDFLEEMEGAQRRTYS